MLYKYLAVYIRIQGMYDVPVQCRSHCSSLVSSIEEARKFFRKCILMITHVNTKTMGKLFTGSSCYIKLVPSKPSRIGLWMYQLVAQLSNGLPILIHMQMQAVETVREERAPVHQVVRDWRSVINSFSHRCILDFDSYYFSADSVNVWRSH